MLRRLRSARANIDVVKNPHAVALGRLGGAKGGRARSVALTPERRRAIARAAAAARWTGALPELLRSAFWNYRFDELNVADHRDLITLQVLASGNAEQKGWLRRRLGDEEIARWIRARRARGLTLAQVADWIPAATVRRWHRADPNAATWEARR
jgi:hypothetical protein